MQTRRTFRRLAVSLGALAAVFNLVAPLDAHAGTTTGVGAISGRVTDGAGNGLRFCQVNAWTNAGVFVNGFSSQLDGTYTIPDLAPGVYRVEAVYGCGRFPTPVWHPASPDFASATPVGVTSSFTTTGIDIAFGGGTKGSITGTVRAEDGTLLANCFVRAFDVVTGIDDGFAVSYFLDTVGRYVMSNLNPGDYKVSFGSCASFGPDRLFAGEFYANKPDLASADVVTVTAATSTNNVDASLAEVTPGGISGRVTDGTGNPVRFCQVNAWGTGGLQSNDTDMNGYYSIGNLVPGTAKVEVVTGCAGFGVEWYLDAADHTTATPVLVSSGAITDEINIDLGDGSTGSISGTVRTDAGVPLANCFVRAYDVDTGFDEGFAVSNFLDPVGHYAMSNLEPGNYRVQFSSCRSFDPDRLVAGEYYLDKVDAATATLVTVTGGAGTTGVDATLTQVVPASISGRVTDPAGNGVGFCQVNAWQPGNLSSNTTDANGYYRIDNLLPGSVTVEVVTGCGGFPVEWYLDKPDPQSATPVNVTGGVITPNINLQLGAPVVVVRATSTSVSCTGPVVVGEGSTCTATVTDTEPTGAASPPDGSVGMSTGSAGAFTTTTCSLLPASASSSSCAVTYTPTAVDGGTHTVGAAYTPAGTTHSDSADPDGGTLQVGGAATSIQITSDLPDPSIVGQAFTVRWSLAVVAPGNGSPSGTVTVTGGSGCSAPVATGECSVTAGVAGPLVLNATYAPDANFGGSSDDENHTVSPPAPVVATCNGLTATLVGTPGDDTIIGTDAPDVIAGLDGNDDINGLGGNDVICGGDGNDTLHGGHGDDHVQGDKGDDLVQGGSGGDVLKGNVDVDNLNGGPGSDSLDGGDSTRDRCNGAADPDTATRCEQVSNVP